jgi:hypothetical protein
VGLSKKAAWTAIEYTALSRIVMGIACLVSPALLCLALKRFTVGKYRNYKIGVEVFSIVASLAVFAPASVALFPAKLNVSGSTLEKEFAQMDKAYFSKGI